MLWRDYAQIPDVYILLLDIARYTAISGIDQCDTMELDIQYDESLDCLIIEASGDITFSDLPTINEEVHAHEKFQPNVAQICNCSDGALILTWEELRAFAKAATEYAQLFGEERKLALVDSKPVNFGMMRQYEALLDTGPDVAIHVFKSMADARDWIMAG